MPLRAVAAVAIVVGGLVHLDLYFDGYREITTANVGRAFLANGIASVIVAGLLVVRRDVIVRLAGIALAAGTLASFAMSRTLDDGFFGFTEKGMEPSPQAVIALVAEIAAIVALAASFLPAVRWRRQALVNPIVGGALALAFVAVAVVASAVWANRDTSVAAPPSGSDETTVTTESAGGDSGGGATAVTIKGFAFDPKEIDITVGDTVTWTNEDGATHTVESVDGAFAESDGLGQGETFTHTFDTAGTFNYVCGIHTGMKATVVVSG
ncbi:MAG: plastocyanin/azurin family copper-binding protein [Ilumatobacteraceae bacterium]